PDRDVSRPPGSVTGRRLRARTGMLVDLTGREAPWPPAALTLWERAHGHAIRDANVWERGARRGDHRLRSVLATVLELPAESLVTTTGARGAVPPLAMAHGSCLVE